MSGVKVNNGAVIAANSHVIKNVEPYEVVGGNPARHIKFRFKDEIIKELLELKWWELSNSDIKNISHLLTNQAKIENLEKIKRILEKK
jgi:serine acetyltransferase